MFLRRKPKQMKKPMNQNPSSTCDLWWFLRVKPMG